MSTIPSWIKYILVPIVPSFITISPKMIADNRSNQINSKYIEHCMWNGNECDHWCHCQLILPMHYIHNGNLLYSLKTKTAMLLQTPVNLVLETLEINAHFPFSMNEWMNQLINQGFLERLTCRCKAYLQDRMAGFSWMERLTKHYRQSKCLEVFYNTNSLFQPLSVIP